MSEATLDQLVKEEVRNSKELSDKLSLGVQSSTDTIKAKKSELAKQKSKAGVSAVSVHSNALSVKSKVASEKGDEASLANIIETSQNTQNSQNSNPVPETQAGTIPGEVLSQPPNPHRKVTCVRYVSSE